MAEQVEQAQGEKEPLIVVGVDGSDPSRGALRWAIHEAQLRKAKVLALHAWSYPVALAYSPYVPAVSIEELQKAEEAVAADMVAQVGTGSVEVRAKTVEGPAALALAEAAKEADLLVMGSRGHGGFTGLLLGSVSQQCAHHAPCPLVIVRSER